MTTQPTAVPDSTAAPEVWAIVDVMGHNRHVGMIDSFTFAGFAFVRVRTPQRDGTISRFLVGPGSVYQITDITQERAMRLLGLVDEPIRHIEQREEFMLDAVDPDDIGDDSDEYSDHDSDDDMADPDDQPTDTFDPLLP